MGLLPLLDASDVLVLHCPLCYFHTHWLNHLEIHFNHEHSNENVDFMLYQCSKCRKIASCKTFLYEHIDICHKRSDSYNYQIPCINLKNYIGFKQNLMIIIIIIYQRIL
ncbi:unnamed protein product [Schistosoma mattheei]|uniref:Uncharacterized protein n=1 Tax=Schistosoma mattheei TaxID=31246 RepID=A0A183P4A6_9TREM|nr:unnamed protein product [Schistosoma mattheei]